MDKKHPTATDMHIPQTFLMKSGLQSDIWVALCVCFFVLLLGGKKGKNSFTLVKLDKSFSPPDINQT